MKSSLIGITLALSATLSHASVVYFQDDFTGNAGALITESTPEIDLSGNGWINVPSQGPNISGTGTLISQGGNNRGALVDLSTANGDTFEVSADVNINSKWIGLGFTSGTNNVFGSGGPFVIFSANGNIDLYAGDGTTNQKISQNISYTPGTTTNLSVSFDKSTNQATVTVGGTVVHDGVSLTHSTGDFNLGYAIIHLRELSGGVGFADDFTVTTSTIPEPGKGAALLGIVILGTCFAIRKSHFKSK